VWIKNVWMDGVHTINSRNTERVRRDTQNESTSIHSVVKVVISFTMLIVHFRKLVVAKEC